MSWLKVAKKVVTFLPGLAASLTGAAAGKTGKVVAALLGVEAKPGIVEKALDNPEAMDKLMALEELSLEAERLRLADVQSAREREKAIVEVTGGRDTFMYALAAFISAGFFTLTGILMFVPLPDGSSAGVNILFGGLVGAFVTMVNYYWGSSKSSSEKTKSLLAAK